MMLSSISEAADGHKLLKHSTNFARFADNTIVITCTWERVLWIVQAEVRMLTDLVTFSNAELMKIILHSKF